MTIKAEGENQTWGREDFIVQKLPSAGDGSSGEYLALIRTRTGAYGRFHATASRIPRGTGFLTHWDYYVEFDDGSTGRQMCRDSEIKPRKTFTALLKEIVPQVS